MDERQAIQENERVATVTILRDGSPVTINATDYAAGDELAPGSDLPPGYVAPEAKGKGGKGGKAPAPPTRFTMQIDGKHYLTDADGNKLNPAGFDTAEAAAAAPIVTA